MSIYDEMRALASEIMPEFKQGDIRYVDITSDPGASPDEAGTPVETVSAQLNATARPVSTKYVDGTHIVQSDRQVTVPNDGVATPDISGKMRIDGVDYKIIDIMPRPAAGDPITWAVIVRR